MYKQIERTCVHCGRTYLGNPNSKYCGYDCSHTARRRRIILICQECSKDFEVQSWSKSTKYCSFKCKVKAQSSDIIDVECTYCHKTFKRKEHLVTRNTSGNSFCSKQCADNFNRGSNHYEWKEHLHDKNEKLALKQWAVKIKERDDFTCQLCGETNRDVLEAHHMKSRTKFRELQFDFNNGITLCLKCHALQHLNDPKSLRLIRHKMYKYERRNEKEST